jgi:hypothetical protein
MTEFHKNLINDVIARIATEMAREQHDLYELQDYLGSFDCDNEGLTYPDGDSVSLGILRGDN